MTANENQAGLIEKVLSFNAPWVSKIKNEKRHSTQRGSFETTNGDQTPVTGMDSQILRMMWHNGGDYNPLNNSYMSQWSRDCYDGSLVKLKKHLAQNPHLLSQRESILHMGGLHHIIAGARTIEPLKCNKAKFLDNQLVKVTKSTDHVKCIMYLLDEGSNVEAKDLAGHTPLHHCVTRLANTLTLQIAKILVDAGGADVNAVNRFGATPLFEPVANNRIDCVDFLMQHGAKVDIEDNEGISLFRWTYSNCFPSNHQKKMYLTMALQAKSEKEATVAQARYKVCAACNSDGNNQRCTGCYMKWYCGVDCQSHDWKTHKSIFK